MTDSKYSPNKEMTVSEKNLAGPELSKEQVARNATWGAALMTAAGLLFVVLGFVIAEINSWKDYILLGAPAMLFIAGLSSIVLLRRGRIVLGTGLIFAANLIVPFIENLLQKDIGLVIFAYTLVSSGLLLWRTVPASSRRWASILAGAALSFIVFTDAVNPSTRISPADELVTLIFSATVILAVIFVVEAARQSWKSFTHSISNRLTALALMVTIPLLIGITSYVSIQARAEIEARALENLKKNNQSLVTNASLWLEMNVRTLKGMTTLPDMVNMNAARQKPVLLAIARTHPNLFLVHTVGLNGMNVARNDDAEPINYSDRIWFQGARAGSLITYEALISRTIGKPALAISTPIYNKSGKIVGVGSIVSELNEISNEVLSSEKGQGITYIVDANNRVIAHPDPAYTEGELRDLSAYPPVAALREGKTGQFTFTDEDGVAWVAYVDRLDNNWGIIAQITETELYASSRQFQMTVIFLIILGALVMFALAWFVIQRSLQPIGELTTTVSAIAAGDLTREAEVNSQDEIGVLASTFNTMTAQIRDLIGSLEERVAARTKDLATVAEVGTAISTILETDKLLQSVVDLTKERFNLYHSHIYLLDEKGENLVLAAGAGEPGRIMASEKRSIPLDREQSLVARAARERKGVTVNDVTQAPDFLPNPLLPDTRSELAVPMVVGSNLIGVFDIQSDVVGRFADSDINIQTTLAAQVATSIQNVRSFEQSKVQADLESLMNAIGQKIQRATTVEDTLQTAVREIGLALGAARVSASIGASRTDGFDDGPSQN